MLKQQQANIAAAYAVTYILRLHYCDALRAVRSAEADGELISRRKPRSSRLTLSGGARRQDRQSGVPEVSSARLSGLRRRRPHGEATRGADRAAHRGRTRAARRQGHRSRMSIRRCVQAMKSCWSDRTPAVIVAAEATIGEEIEGEHVMRSVAGGVARGFRHRARTARQNAERNRRRCWATRRAEFSCGHWCGAARGFRRRPPPASMSATS